VRPVKRRGRGAAALWAFVGRPAGSEGGRPNRRSVLRSGQKARAITTPTRRADWFSRPKGAIFPRLAARKRRRYKRRDFSRQQEAKPAMALERTFSILKPDVTRRNLTGAVNARIEAAGLRIVAQKRVHMTRAQAETFYGVHRERPFFGELVEMMTAAPVVVQVLEGDNAIQRYRDVMGATNPDKAAAGTIRKDFALSMGENSVHGSDAPATAAVEIAQFFAGNEIVG